MVLNPLFQVERGFNEEINAQKKMTPKRAYTCGPYALFVTNLRGKNYSTGYVYDTPYLFMFDDRKKCKLQLNLKYLPEVARIFNTIANEM